MIVNKSPLKITRRIFRSLKSYIARRFAGVQYSYTKTCTEHAHARQLDFVSAPAMVGEELEAVELYTFIF